MAERVSLSVRYGSYMPVLLQALLKTSGDVLELGGGVYSTHVLHSFSLIRGRNILTVENDPFWYRWCKTYESDHHKVVYVDKWEDAPIEGAWDIVLIDHSPNDRRALEAMRVANLAKFLILHDANGRYDKHYHYSEIYQHFRYKFTYDKLEPATVVLSNLVDLKDFL